MVIPIRHQQEQQLATDVIIIIATAAASIVGVKRTLACFPPASCASFLEHEKGKSAAYLLHRPTRRVDLLLSLTTNNQQQRHHHSSSSFRRTNHPCCPLPVFSQWPASTYRRIETADDPCHYLSLFSTVCAIQHESSLTRNESAHVSGERVLRPINDATKQYPTRRHYCSSCNHGGGWKVCVYAPAQNCRAGMTKAEEQQHQHQWVLALWIAVIEAVLSL
jgi:hypothetical protein